MDLLIEGLNKNQEIDDIIGSIASKTNINIDNIGDVEVLSDKALMEVENDSIDSIVEKLDGKEIGSSDKISITRLDEKEHDYYMSLLEYFEEYNRLVELEREEEMRQHQQEIEEMDGEERESKGRAMLNMEGEYKGEELEGHLVKFTRENNERLPETEITVGDLIMVSKKNPEREDNPDGTVTQKTNHSITVAFDNKPASFVFTNSLRVDLYVDDITYQRMKTALENLVSNREGNKKKLRDIIVGLEDPEESEPVHIRKWNNERLNLSQKEAVKKSLSSEPINLVHGPPGTGKTTTAVEIIFQAVKEDKSVLATADSNVAVDNLMEFLIEIGLDVVRIGHPARVNQVLKDHTLDALIKDDEDYQEAQKLREKAFSLKEKQEELTYPSGKWRRGMSNEKIKSLAEENKSSRGVPSEKIKEMSEYLELDEQISSLFQRADKLREKAINSIIEDVDVVCSTNSTSGSDLLSNKNFDLVVIDEATQAVEPSCLIPITKTDKVILVGDHKQLPPTIKNKKASEEGLSKTLFERLANKHPEIKDLLTVQYRMHYKIMNFISEEFYDGGLHADATIKWNTLNDLNFDYSKISEKWKNIFDPEETITLIDTKNIEASDRTPPGSTSKENKKEAGIVNELVNELDNSGIYPEDIGIITPYKDQVDLISKKINDEKIEIKTVDGFQGREKEVIIISMVRSNPRKEIGFLSDMRRLNVALTRAKKKLIIVGDSSTLKSNKTYEEFIDYVDEEGLIHEIQK